MADNEISKPQGQGITRRTLVAGAGGIGLGALLGGFAIKGLIQPDEVSAYPLSEGYLLVDTKKCAGCDTCMLTCSVVHSGRANLTLSRIQVTKNALGKFPNDMEQIQCRQCPTPSCVPVCPTGAMHVSEKNGNVRMVDEAKCIGCQRCINACPFTPSRVQWNHEDRTALKCDLCANTPYWNEEGGSDGKQACVESCPERAISFTKFTPVQQEDAGYRVNLRNEHWAFLMLDPTDLGKEDEFVVFGSKPEAAAAQ